MDKFRVHSCQWVTAAPCSYSLVYEYCYIKWHALRTVVYMYRGGKSLPDRDAVVVLIYRHTMTDQLSLAWTKSPNAAT